MAFLVVFWVVFCMIFWMAFWMALTVDAKVMATDDTRLGGRVGDGKHDASLRSLLWVAPDPLLLSIKDQATLLVRTPVGQGIAQELRRLLTQYAAAAGRMQSTGEMT